MDRSITRREFLQAAVTAPFALPWPSWMPRMAFAPFGKAVRGDVLLVVFLRGAADALNIVVPHGEEAYYRQRPTLSVPRPDDVRAKAGQRAVDLDGFFGLHPRLGSLMEAWQTEHLAIVHACGAPDESRSHFKAMELMERGVSDEHGPASGWISRHLASLSTGNPSPLRAIGLGDQVPRSLRGAVPVTALRSIADFHLGGDLAAAGRIQSMLSNMYQSADPLGPVGQETLEILDTLEALDPAGYQPRAGATFPESDFGESLRQVAMLVKADVGLEVAAIDVGGWDTHFAQGSTEGLMPGLLTDLADGLAALHADLVDHLDDLTVVVMSEFGRRVPENASLGTDHGHGSALLLLGGGLKGGLVHGPWPGLEPEQLFGPGDLAVTTDYRDVLGEICLKRLNNPALSEIFPAYRVQPTEIARFRP
ncbi:MAG: DUF1501 domain-containing protein [Anaerolineales bacterium]